MLANNKIIRNVVIPVMIALSILYIIPKNEKCTRENEAELRVYRKTIAQLETEMSIAYNRIRLQDAELTKLKRS